MRQGTLFPTGDLRAGCRRVPIVIYILAWLSNAISVVVTIPINAVYFSIDY